MHVTSQAPREPLALSAARQCAPVRVTSQIAPVLAREPLDAFVISARPPARPTARPASLGALPARCACVRTSPC